MTLRQALVPTRRRFCCAVIAALWVAPSVAAWAAQVQPETTAPADASPTVVSGVELAVMITNADWIYKPSSSTMDEFIPRKVTKNVGHHVGEVVLKCKLHPDATVSDCSVIDETNPDIPFGEAALRASSIFRIRPRAANGTATDAKNWVLIPISYDITVIRR